MNIQPIAISEKRELHTKRVNKILPVFRDKLVFSTHTAYYVVNKKQVLYLEAKGNYSLIHLNNGKKITLSLTLKKIYDRLYQTEFLRVHASYIINLYSLTGICKNGRYEVILNDSLKLPVSETYKKDLTSLLNRLKI